MKLDKLSNNQSIVKQIIKMVEKALANKELKPGDLFPSESDLVKNLGVSKSSVREAVKMLEAMGVLEIKKGEGTFVRSHPTADSINFLIFSLLIQQSESSEIIELRRIFEPAYTILAMEKALPEDIENIRISIDRFYNAIKRGTATIDDDLAFHNAILEATHNNFVIRIGNVINDLFAASITKAMNRDLLEAYDRHNKIFDAFVKKDKEKLREEIINSIKDVNE